MLTRRVRKSARRSASCATASPGGSSTAGPSSTARPRPASTAGSWRRAPISARRVDRLVERLLDEQLEDGGWNCEAPPSTRSSFHSTICVLEGLLEYEKAQGPTTAVTDARARARGLSPGAPHAEVAGIRRGDRSPLDALLVSGHLALRRAAGTGLSARRRRQARRAGRRGGRAGGEAAAPERAMAAERPSPRSGQRLPFDMETEVGRASRWNTLRALRVLDWYGN